MEAVESLLHGNASPAMKTKGGRSALHIAASCGHATVLRALCDAGGEDFDVDCLNAEGQTALHFAAHHGAFSPEHVLDQLRTLSLTPTPNIRRVWRGSALTPEKGGS